MAERVEADMKTRSFDRAVTVFLGDYIDRGPGSKRVVEQLASGDWPTSIITLAGNHEDFLITFLNDARFLAFWRSQGGLETLHSYGVDVGQAMAGRDFAEVQAAFMARFPKHHRDFLEALKVSTSIGDYFFCHAGIRPGVALDCQNRDDLVNIREPFLSSEVEHGKLVVHGHTPAVAPEIRPNRIGIDTAAYASGRLTCLVLENQEHRFLADFVNGGQ
jgi:serine/threonine protein phosphatase 1